MTTIGNNDTTGREAAIHINHIEGAIGHLANHCDGVYCSSLREAIDFISRHSDSRVEVLEKALKGLVSAIDVDPYECPQCGSRLPIEDVDKNSLQHNDGCELHAAHLALSGEGTQPQCHTSSSAESCCSSSLERSSAKCAEPIIKESDASPSSTGEQVKELRKKISEARFVRDNAVPAVHLAEDDVEALIATIERLEGEVAWIANKIRTQFKDYSAPTDGRPLIQEIQGNMHNIVHRANLLPEREAYALKMQQERDAMKDQLRYIDKRCEEQIQDRIRLGEALTLATRERDEARKVIERLDDVQLESLRTRFNQLGDEAQPGSVLDRFLDDVEACICASELARDFLSKQEGK